MTLQFTCLSENSSSYSRKQWIYRQEIKENQLTIRNSNRCRWKRIRCRPKRKHVQLSFISCVLSRNAFFRDTPQAHSVSFLVSGIDKAVMHRSWSGWTEYILLSVSVPKSEEHHRDHSPRCVLWSACTGIVCIFPSFRLGWFNDRLNWYHPTVPWRRLWWLDSAFWLECGAYMCACEQIRERGECTRPHVNK